MRTLQIDKKLLGTKCRSLAWLLTCISLICVVEGSLAGEPDTTFSADQRLEEGRKAYQQGSFAQAIIHWTEASQTYEREG